MIVHLLNKHTLARDKSVRDDAAAETDKMLGLEITDFVQPNTLERLIVH
jgi:hypothetical protein